MKNNSFISLYYSALLCCFLQKSFSQNIIDRYLTDPLVYTTIGTSTNSINQPRDLDFKPNSNELWVVNYGATNGGNVVVFYNAGKVNQTSQYKKDSHTSHFMMYPSSLAFSDIGEWASTSEIKNTASANSTFMGPSLWSADTNITAKIFQNNWVNGYPLGSHLDMLHQSPFAMGIAHDTAKAYWVFDGYNNNLCKYDFNVDHSPGYDNHSSGKIWRYTDVNVMRATGIPSHMVLDKSTKWLYIVDAGNKRLMRISTTTGTVSGNLSVPGTSNEPLTLYKSVTGITQQVIQTFTSQPCGIDYYNNRLIVSDYATGEIRVYDTSVPTPSMIGIIATGQTGIMGVKIGYDGKIWFVNNTQNKIVRIDPLQISNDASIFEIVSPLTQNAETKFYSPTFNSCNTSISPQVKLQNMGSNNLTSVNINYSVDGGTVTTFNWSGNLASGAIVTVTLSTSTVSNGTHKIKVYTSNPNANSDLNPLNDTKEGSFRNISSVMGLPFNEDFTNTVFPPIGWAYMGYNKFCNMSRNASVGGYGTGLGALKMDNFTGPMNITGQKDYFLSPRINFSTATDITFLTFDLAYAQRNSSSTDKLDVSISTNCGATWTSLYNKAGSILSTTNSVNFIYTPSTDDWRTDSIDISMYKGQSEVMFMFTTNSNWGNNLYIDNINITSYSTVGIHKNKVLSTVSIFPNPSSGKIKIEGLNTSNTLTEIKVMNVIGQEVKTISTNENKIEIDLSEYNNGAYFIILSNGKDQVVKKFILSKN